MTTIYPILTAAEFIAQGTSYAGVLSVAKANAGTPADRKLRQVAREVAEITGMPVRPRRGSARRNDSAKRRAA
ncbi:hypothetical protein ACFPOD_05120 [Nitratireductor kimnyeongensis]|uniref:Uncharacterized protein n=1 Tax=Nitratireductor kimnyeongensis TaxID=430679 RepID=A0ABW0T5U2_9HYPH|nr:hypothetical protein [Nitratireductor kimnyeongensis]QZZ34536.1 hypothetical protein KW403_12080 [Nitratireductor kimnyeongensis]